MAPRGQETRRVRGRPAGPDIQVQDDVVSALIRHPTWSITKTEKGLIYSRLSKGSPDVFPDSDIGVDQVARLKKHIGKAFRGSVEQLLLRFRSSLGSDQDLQIHLQPVVKEDGVQRVVGSTTALTEAGQSTERARLADTVLTWAMDCVVVMDHEGRIVEFNPAAEETFGFTREEALKMKVSDLMPPEIAATHEERLAHILETGEAPYLDQRLEMMMRRADGTIFPAELSSSMVPDMNPPLFVGFLRDLSECKRTEEALLDSELRLRAIAEKVPDVIYHYRLRPEPKFEYVSLACASVLGYEVEDFYADPSLWQRIVHPDDLPRLDRALRGQPPTAMLSLRCIRKDGTRIDCQLGNSVVRDRWGKVAASVGVLRDETERLSVQRQLRESADRLQRANAERLRLLHKIVGAHEDERRSIATAIHDDSIQAVSALAIRVSAMRRKVTDEALRKSLSEIETSVSEAVSRLRRLMFDLHPTTLDRRGLAATVEAHLTLFTNDDTAAYSLSNSLTREPSQRVRLALYRVIQEAIANARKHAGAENIVVLLSEDRGEFVGRVHDDGIGFEVGEIESPAGHLGLSTMRERAEMAGGSLAIESSPGRGTYVEVRIPAEPDQPFEQTVDLPTAHRDQGNEREDPIVSPDVT
jgi:PAS domain S-box-containing protein